MTRAHLRETFTDGSGDVMDGRAVTLYEIDGTTPIATPVYANATGSTLATMLTDGSGEIAVWSNVPKRVQIAVAGRATKVVSAFLGDVVQVRVTDFGATGDGVTDDTAALQAAIDYAQALTAGNGEIYVSPGIYLHTGLTISGMPILQGAGANHTILRLKQTVADTVDNLTWTPLAQNRFGALRDITIEPVSVNNGRHALAFDLNADGRFVSNFTVENCKLTGSSSSTSNGRAISDIPDATPTVPALLDWRIDGCWLVNGVKLVASAGSLWWHGNLSSGSNAGLEVDNVAGAAGTVIRDSRFTNAGGGIWGKTQTTALHIVDNVFSQDAAWTGGSGNTALIDLDGTTAGDHLTPFIRGNHLSIAAGFGGAGKSAIRLKTVTKAVIEPNTYALADASTVGLLVTTGSTGTFFSGGNKLESGSGTLLSNSVDTAAELGLVRHVNAATTVAQAGNVDLVGAFRASRFVLRPGTTIASADTVAPNGPADGSGGNIFFVTGVTTINTITPRTGPGNTVDGDVIILILVSGLTLGSAGNIVPANAAAIGASRAIMLVYQTAGPKWYEIGVR